MYLLAICVISGKNVFRPIAYFLTGSFGFLLLSCISSLSVLDVNPLSDVWFANLQFHGSPFHFVDVSCAVQNCFRLISCLLIFTLPFPHFVSDVTI